MLRCGMCGHQWMRRSWQPNPRRCPAAKCRSEFWDDTKQSKLDAIFTERHPEGSDIWKDPRDEPRTLTGSCLSNL